MEHPSQIVYNKQIEFFDRVAPLLFELNNYVGDITSIQVFDKNDDNYEKLLKRTAGDNQAVKDFYELVESYYVYLPQELLVKAAGVRESCFVLEGGYMNEKHTATALGCLVSFQDSVREFIGIDKLSEDLFKALTTKNRKSH